MKVMVLGSTGATGRLVVRQLLERGCKVIAVLRPGSHLVHDLGLHPDVTAVHAEIASLSPQALAEHLQGCDAVISCLGHNLTFKGMFGQPRQLVTDAMKTVCKAIVLNRKNADSESNKCRVVLMNTTGNSNRDIPEQPPLSQQVVVTLLRYLLPPHRDNEMAADHLRQTVGQQHDAIEWVAVRPDALVDEDTVTEYDLHPSPTRNAIFDSGASSRINVAHCLVEMALGQEQWQQWKGKMPVLYNRVV